MITTKFRGWNGKRMTRGMTLNEMLSTQLEHNGLKENWLQFTGLKDVKGEEIYKGDIVKYEDRIGYVQFYSESEGYDYSGWGYSNQQIGEQLQDTEVIGNIYENFELLF